MSNRTRAVDDARRGWHQRRLELGRELRGARIQSGLAQRTVATAVGVSASEISRRERGDAPSVTLAALTEHAAAVGLKLTVKMYPTGGGVRDEGQLRYTRRLLERVSDAFHAELEAVIPLAGDLRAVDLLLRAPGCAIAVEVITRFSDAQAQIRAARLKARDMGATRALVVVADTHANRRALDAARAVLAHSWDFDSRRVLRALGAGLAPERDAIISI